MSGHLFQVYRHIVVNLSHPRFTLRPVSRYNRAMSKILVVDDEPPIVDVLSYNLKQAGYEVIIARDGEQAVAAARRDRPDLIILDLMLPKIDGLEVFRLVRRESETPVIMLTARDSEIDRVVGLELGADDYVVKPFSVRELMVRVKNVLRRSIPRPVAAAPDRVHVAELSLDVARHEARWGDVLLELTALEFAMLHTLARHADQVLSRVFRKADKIVCPGTLHVHQLVVTSQLLQPEFAQRLQHHKAQRPIRF